MNTTFPLSLPYIYAFLHPSEKNLLILQENDAALVQYYRHGNADAFSILVERHLSSVYSYAYRITQNAALAEDIAQETFIKAWKKIGSFKDGGNFKTWLFSIAHNTAIDFLRQEKHFVFSDFDAKNQPDTLAHIITDTAPTPHARAIINEHNDMVSQALNRLHDIDRAIMTLHYNEGFSFVEIGEILKTPHNTVKSRHRRALKILQGFMNASKAIL
jgi:RNA polymerase sigma-70 factor (ECF subfamily)